MRWHYLPAALLVVGSSACTLGSGEGEVKGQLDVPGCWSGAFDLNPDFFAGIPYRTSYQIRVQQSADYANFADGISVLVTDVTAVRRSLGVPLAVGLPPGVSPPGVPIMADPDPALVNFTLYLGRTCRSQTAALYGVKAALANADGTCDVNGPSTCGQGAMTPAGAKTVSSTITFAHIFNGDPDEPSAQERLTEATFDVYLIDPRDICPGGLGAPPRCRGHLTGRFKFYFERGRPAQPFP
jgi:hypothetical protein